MKKSYVSLLFSLFLLLLLPQQIKTAITISASLETDENIAVLSKTQWEKMGDSDVLIPENRWLFLDNNKQVRERKAQMLVNASIENVAGLIRNYRRVPQWMNGVDETQLLKRHDKNFWVIFMIFKLPWPLRNKYLITEVREEQHPFLPMKIFKTTSSNQYTPPYECSVNDFGHYESVWKVYAIDSQLTYVSFSAYSTADPQFPRWLQDPIINRSFIKSMEGFYELLQN